MSSVKFYLVGGPVLSTQEHLQFHHPQHQQLRQRWGLSQSPACFFCIDPELLLHIIAGCQQYLDRFTWRHESILNFIAKSLQPVINVHSSLYADC